MSASERETALAAAIADDDLAKVTTLLALGTPLTDDERFTAFGRSRSPEVLARVLEHTPDINIRDKAGGTLLLSASIRADAATTKLLLARGADPNLFEHGFSPLLYWTDYANLELVTALLERKADPNTFVTAAEDRYGADGLNGDATIYSPLCHAVDRNNLELVTVLLDHGARVDAPCDRLFDGPPLSVVAIHMNIGSRDEDRRTALAIIDLLIARGEDVNAKSGQGYTALDESLSADGIAELRKFGATGEPGRANRELAQQIKAIDENDARVERERADHQRQFGSTSGSSSTSTQNCQTVAVSHYDSSGGFHTSQTYEQHCQ